MCGTREKKPHKSFTLQSGLPAEGIVVTIRPKVFHHPRMKNDETWTQGLKLLKMWRYAEKKKKNFSAKMSDLEAKTCKIIA